MPTPTNVSVHMCSYCRVDPADMPSTEPAQSDDWSSYSLATMLVEQSADEVTMYVMPHSPKCLALSNVIEAHK